MHVGLLQVFTKEGTFFRGLGNRGVLMEEGVFRGFWLAYRQSSFEVGSETSSKLNLKKNQ